MNIQKNGYLSIEQLTDRYLGSAQRTENHETTEGLSFQDILQQKSLTGSTGNLKFSKHAVQRLESRNIILSDEQSARLEEGVKKAGDKGINESLVLVDSLAFIVNVPNRTVVTAMDQTESDSNIFTNIDGAVIM